MENDMMKDQDKSGTAGALSGACGHNVVWSLTEDGELIISGQGRMEDYSYVLAMDDGNQITIKWDAPWSSYADSITKVVVESEVTYIGGNAFRFKNLKTVLIGDAVEMIGANAFRDCQNLSMVRLGSSVSVIKQYAFCNCEALSNITFPAGLMEIGKAAFQGCPQVQMPVIKKPELKEIKPAPGAVTLGGSPLEVTYEVLEDGTLRIRSGRISQTDMRRGELKIPDSVNGARISEIGLRAFFGMDGITGAVLPSGLRAVGKESFRQCNSLRYVTFGECLREIQEGAFSMCTSLEHVVIPEGTKSIRQEAFNGCNHLLSIKIPSTVESIEPDVFRNCYRLAVSVTAGSEAERYCERNKLTFFSGVDADGRAEKGAPASWLTECHLGRGFVADIGPFLKGGRKDEQCFAFQTVLIQSMIIIQDKDIEDFSQNGLKLSDEEILRLILGRKGRFGESRPQNVKRNYYKGMVWVSYDFTLEQKPFHVGIVVKNAQALTMYCSGYDGISSFLLQLHPVQPLPELKTQNQAKQEEEKPGLFQKITRWFHK